MHMTKPGRALFLLSVVSLLAAAACTLAVVAGWIWWARSSRPLNVVLVTFDTTRADRLGVYGYPPGLTEVLDRFAGQGVVFDRAYAPVPLTLPSHATMLTGLYPPEHGLRVNGSGELGNDVPLLSDLLKRRGYDTGAFIAAFVLNSKFGLSRGFDVYDDDLSGAEPAGEHSFDRGRIVAEGTHLGLQPRELGRDLGGTGGIVPELGVGSLPFELAELRALAVDVKGTPSRPRCARRAPGSDP
jgi:hypothetical protein